jgi:hypothetical protein
MYEALFSSRLYAHGKLAEPWVHWMFVTQTEQK